ncbi:hypothetical protein [Nocardia transvalensis]|uniref:hypothetical protein n=1 Tax=Nocardia transvalensis TaxID=37333 RepID=UPI0018940F77|nr:hypothetical protein [Nocardia transvalensis]MBF6333429.1 hypothetical protein [Nocardia transvalensis]
MPNAMKRKGDTYEISQLRYYRVSGFPHAQRTRAGYTRDGGDIHLDPVVGLAPGVISQCKNVRTPRWSQWITDLREQVRNANAQFGFLAWKRHGVSDPAEQLAVMPMAEFLYLVRLAGYGNPIEEYEA